MKKQNNPVQDNRGEGGYTSKGSLQSFPLIKLDGGQR